MCHLFALSQRACSNLMLMGPKEDASLCHGFGMMQDMVHSNQTNCNANWCKLIMSTNKGCTDNKVFSFFQWTFYNSFPINFIVNMFPRVIITLQVLARDMANTWWLFECQIISNLDVFSLYFIPRVSVMFLVHALH